MMSWERSITLKTTHEIEIMREAGRINAEALIAAKNAIQPGVTTADLDAAAAEVIRKHGAKPAFLGVPGAFPILQRLPLASMMKWCMVSPARNAS